MTWRCSMSGIERQELLGIYKDLRVADVRDGMDWMMMHDLGSMDPTIRPIWRTRAIGIARTARYLPFSGVIPKMNPDEYSEWQAWYYTNVCTYPWMDEIEPGDFIVIDQSEVNAGLCGSNNTLSAIKKGARGFISNGGVRDTDEIIIQKIPFWAKICSQSMVQGRLQFDNQNTPVCVGGIIVNPGDIIVADGDGVIVVPSQFAKDVAIYAQHELINDKITRRKLYEEMGWKLDETVR